ncbi:MAG: YeeE/YedE thiosulfate transporter family protein, partial [Pseudomonadales bacterium]
MISLSDKVWSPYVAGALIGLLQIPAFMLMDTGLGASSSFVKFAGHAALIFDPTVADGSYFSKYITSSKYVWQTALVIGIALGAFLSMRLSNARRDRISPVWKEAMGVSSPIARY